MWVCKKDRQDNGPLVGEINFGLFDLAVSLRRFYGILSLCKLFKSFMIGGMVLRGEN
jgi:hypothetical protein